MPRPQFSEMLVNRRRQLGLSISQASQVLRLKEQVLIAFEEGDFEHIPKSGYAQGMLSSYARYLGLNPRQVVNQFSEDLNEYNRAGRTVSSPDDREGDTYMAPKKLLPTSGGPAGDLGAFATTSQPHSRQQSSPLVNSRRYVGTLHDENDRTYGYDTEDEYYPESEEHPYTTRQPVSSQRTRSTSSARARTRRAGERSAYGQDNVTTRRPASGSYGENVSRSNQTNAAQRQARRAQAQRRQAARAQGQVAARQNGIMGMVLDFFSDQRHVFAAAIAGVALVLTLGIIFAMRSCSSGQDQSDNKTVPVTQSGSTGTATSGTEGSTENLADKVVDETNEAAKKAENATATSTSQGANGASKKDAKSGKGSSTGASSSSNTKTAKETKVTVSVEKGMVSWVEITCDNESKVATTITGPWSETYDVHDSITIEVHDTTAVTVTENGEARAFEEKTSGIGTITIQGTPEQKTTSSGGSTSSSSTSKTKDSDADSENTENADNTSTEKTKKDRDTGNDEFLYTTEDGYDIYYNESQDLYYTFDADGNKINAMNGTPL